MKAVAIGLGLAAIFLGHSGFAQHHENHDTLRNVEIEEVVVVSQVGINKQVEKEQRASKQANIDQILDRVAGVQMIRRGNYAWEPSIRSLNAAQINLSIDGMAIFGACTDRMDPISSYIEPSNLQQINVNLGSSFQNYGGGMAGGIDFKLAVPDFTDQSSFKGMLGTGYETNAKALQTLGSLQYTTDRYGLLINGIFRKSGNYRAGNQAIISNSQFQKWNASAAFHYKLNDKNTLLAQYLADYGQDIGYPALTMDVAFANANIASLTHTYTSAIPEMSPIRSKVYFNHIDHAMDDTKRPIETVPMHMDMPGLSWTAGLNSETGLSKGNHFFQARVSAYLNRLTANMTMYPKDANPMFMYTLPDVQRHFYSLDISDRYVFNERWGLDVMGTYSLSQSNVFSTEGKEQLSSFQRAHFNRNNHLGNVNLTGHYHPSSNWHVMAKIGYANRAASLQEYYGFYLFNRMDNYDYLGNMDLQTEKSLQASLGLSFQKEWLRLEATAYHYAFKDYIVGSILPDYQVMTIGATGVKQYQNIPDAQLSGAELSFRIQALKNLEWISTSSYTYGQDKWGNALPLIAPFTNNNTFLWKIKDWVAQMEVAYYAEQQHVSPEVYGDTKTGSATLLHAGIRKSFLFKKNRITANMRVENMLDSYYYRHQDIMKIARPGRNFIAQLNISF